MESLKSAIATIKKERDVFIFPEGTRSLDGGLSFYLGFRVEGSGFRV